MINNKRTFFKVKNFTIGRSEKVFIIAEIGINHNGDFAKCKRLILAASQAGANAAKIQTIDVDESYTKNSQSYKAFKNKNFSNNELIKLRNYANNLGIVFFSTPGDLKSLQRLIKIKIPIIKISSGLATNFPLIGEVLKKNIPVIISTGFSTINDLVELKKFLKNFKSKKIVLLKCTSSYPAHPNSIDLNSIKFLKNEFDLPVGYSDHTLGDTAPIVAASLGAVVIEKHFTLNKHQKGGDHKISLEPTEFEVMVKKIRLTEKMLGKGTFELSEEIKKKRKKFLRCLVAKKEIQKGDIFSLENIGFFRHPDGNIGLEPKYYYKLRNKKSKIKFKKGEIFINKHIKLHRKKL